MKIYFPFYLISFTCFITFNSITAQQSKLSQNVNHTTEYIASRSLSTNNYETGDLRFIDSIFCEAVRFTGYDYSEALLALTFACIPYREVPIQIPIIGVILDYPLVSADEKTFNIKNDNLPRYLYYDSPQNDYGDKDKSAHFFGSAYLSHASSIFDLGNLIGYFVEVFEAEFKVQSSIDNRDMQTNKLGQLFGSMLKVNAHVRPSHVLIQQTLFYVRPTQ